MGAVGDDAVLGVMSSSRVVLSRTALLERSLERGDGLVQLGSRVLGGDRLGGGRRRKQRLGKRSDWHRQKRNASESDTRRKHSHTATLPHSNHPPFSHRGDFKSMTFRS